MNERYIIFTIDGGVYFIKNNYRIGISNSTECSYTECSYCVKGLRKLPTTKILENLLTDIVTSVYNDRLILSDIHPEEKVRELFETPVNLVKLVRELPGAFDFRKRVRRAWIL